MSIIRTRSVAISDPGVERDANGLPTAFRLWRPGINHTVDGIDIVDERSILLLKEQVSQHVSRFPFDANHLSIKRTKDEKITPKNQEALGWHELGFRPTECGTEVWAEACEWRAMAREALLDDPPGYLYFSPAFRADGSGRVVAYINCALTNTPAGFSLPSLRSVGVEPSMDLEQLAAILGLEGEAKDAFIAANKDKTSQEIAAALMAPKLDSTAAIVEGDAPKTSSEGAPGGCGGSEPKPELRSVAGLTAQQLQAIVRAEVRAAQPAAPRAAQPAAVVPAAIASDYITTKFRSAIGLSEVQPVAAEHKTWITNAGGTFRIRHDVDRIRASHIGQQFAFGQQFSLKGGA